MMPETKNLPTCDVLMTLTGICLNEHGIDGVYVVLNWMTGENLFTHQLPRVCKEAVPVILAFRPDLAVTCDEAKTVTTENVLEWRRTWIERYGETIAVPKFEAGQHVEKNFLTELKEKVPDVRIVVVKP